MSDQGGTPEAGWHPDPHGRHEYRYWDGQAWSDQVSDGGVVSSDPPGEAPTQVTEPSPAATDTVASPVVTGPPTAATGSGPPSTAAPGYTPPAEKSSGKLPIGVLALIGLAVAAIVAALAFFLLGGDDDGGGEGAGDFSGTISEDEPFFVRTVDLEEGEAMRAIVEPSDDLDATLTLGIDPEVAVTTAFTSLTGDEEVDEDELLDIYGSSYGDLFSDALPEDLTDDFSEAIDASEAFDDFRDRLADIGLEGAGVPLGTADLNGEGDPEGGIFVAPFSGTYSVIIGGLGGSEGDFEGRIDVNDADGDFDGFDADEELDFVAYFEAFEPQRDFLCDEDFWGDEPGDVADSAEQICDDDAFDELLSSDLSSDFSDDFTSDFSDDFSDFSDDLSDDFSDDLSDFSDDVPVDELGLPQEPSLFITEYGTSNRFDRLADSCFDGNLDDCDTLYRETPIADSLFSYEGYGATCGGRLPDEQPGQCAILGGG